MDKETEEQIKELQMLEQNLQAIMMQKQAFQSEMSEIENAFEELEKTKDEVYKIIGNIMLKSSKETILKDLKEKREIIALRVKALDSQEKSFSDHTDELRKKVLSKIKKE